MDDAYYIKAVTDRRAELEQSAWLPPVIASVKKCTGISTIRCLALGQISEYVNPRFQAAFLLIIAEQLHVTDISAWDPAFSAEDKRVLNHFGVQVIETDPEPTPSVLWYVPHGPFSLVQNLPAKIGSASYIGNDLSAFAKESTEKNAGLCAYRERTVITFITPNKRDRWFTAFSSTAVHHLEHE